MKDIRGAQTDYESPFRPDEFMKDLLMKDFGGGPFAVQSRGDARPASGHLMDNSDSLSIMAN